MKGMCQTCGATAPLEWFLREPVSRQVLVTALSLPSPVQERIVDYLALFRPAGGSMSPKKALRLVTEIRDLVAAGFVHVTGRVDRAAHSSHWGRAMEQMIDNRHGLKLPMPNHNYLVKIVHDLADQDDAAGERRIVAAERSGGQVSHAAKSGEPESLADLSASLLARLPQHVKEKYS